MKVIEHLADGTIRESEFELDAATQAIIDAANVEYRRLEAAGTPYWCICKPPVDMFAAMDSGEAYWKEDTYGRNGDGIHGKHGVMHRPCGGYLQEG